MCLYVWMQHGVQIPPSKECHKPLRSDSGLLAKLDVSCILRNELRFAVYKGQSNKIVSLMVPHTRKLGNPTLVARAGIKP